MSKAIRLGEKHCNILIPVIIVLQESDMDNSYTHIHSYPRLLRRASRIQRAGVVAMFGGVDEEAQCILG